jgi:chemotaxis response regulator CheB
VRILVVDDSVVIRKLLTATLSEVAGLEVVATAALGSIALIKIRELRPDIVILDVEMPEMDGIETLKRIRMDAPRLPVIMFSTRTERGAAATIEALTSGASDYVTKPSNAGNVLTAMARVREEMVPKIHALTGGSGARPPAGPVELASRASGSIAVVAATATAPIAALGPTVPASRPPDKHPRSDKQTRPPDKLTPQVVARSDGPGQPARPGVSAAQPSQPIQSARPGASTAHPSQPIQSARPGASTAHPSQPIQSARPGASTAHPSQPIQPAYPGVSTAHPSQPIHSARPGGSTTQPSQPIQPAYPGVSTAHPTQPIQPARPGGSPNPPAQPVRASAGVVQPLSPAQPARPGAGLNHALAPPPAHRPSAMSARSIEIVAIGASTGGPNALVTLLTQLPEDFAVPIVIVQHMLPTFTRHFASRLAAQCRLNIVEASAGQSLEPGHAYIARGDHHLIVERRQGRASLAMNQGELENFCRPSVDVLFRSVAQVYGPGALAVVLTGMGHDGLAGCAAIRQVGGDVIVQDEASSVVWGMPGFVARAGLASQVMPIDQLGPELRRRIALSGPRNQEAMP